MVWRLVTWVCLLSGCGRRAHELPWTPTHSYPPPESVLPTRPPVPTMDKNGRAMTEDVRVRSDGIKIHSPAAYESMRRAGTLAARVLDFITPYVQAGVSTERLDDLCRDFIHSQGAISACLNYKGYPKHICTSINEVVCHGIPSPTTILKDGDIINIDVTVIVDGWHGDTSRMFMVGKPSLQAQKVVQAAYEAMMAGIAAVKPGATTGDIGHAIQTVAASYGFSVVREYCGHGIGRVFHDKPHVLNYGTPGEGVVLEPGMFFTVEPMINVGTYRTKLLKDGWTVLTCDQKLSAQWEHTVGVTDTGCEIFTRSPTA